MNKYDDKLKAIPHYTKFEKMLPWIGNNYDSFKHKKLLLVGESHYYPASEQNKGDTTRFLPEVWYSSKPAVFEGDEEQWIFTRNIIEWGSSTNWKSKGFLMNKNIELAISEAGLTTNSSTGNRPFLFDEVAFMNYFQRPALEGDSFKNVNTTLDSEKAYNNFIQVFNILNPDIIIFTSKYACINAENFELWKITEPKGCKYTYTPHPSCSWWNRVSNDKILKGLTGKNHFISFLNEQKFITE